MFLAPKREVRSSSLPYLNYHMSVHMFASLYHIWFAQICLSTTKDVHMYIYMCVYIYSRFIDYYSTKNNNKKRRVKKTFRSISLLLYIYIYICMITELYLYMYIGSSRRIPRIALWWPIATSWPRGSDETPRTPRGEEPMDGMGKPVGKPWENHRKR